MPKGEWEAEELHRLKQKEGKRNYTNEALALLNHLKILLKVLKTCTKERGVSSIFQKYLNWANKHT